MFKKPLGNLKTSAPLRSSDRRKFKQRIVNDYGLSPEDGELLVPEGLLSQKFSTHLNEPGVVYLSAEGDPLWFTIGKGSDALIPTVYTLWKRPEILPPLSTPAVVVSRLIDGADLMIPGVVQHPAGLVPDQLVSVTQYDREKFGYPLAVGRMAVSSETLRRADEEDTKGKAVIVIHTWKDSLWDLGPSKKLDVPEPRDYPSSAGGATTEAPTEDNPIADTEPTATDAVSPELGEAAPASPPQGEPEPTLTPEDVSFCLRNALLQAISTTLGALPSSAYPMPASVFWSNYVLPARPAQALGAQGLVDASTIDIKRSTFKTVKAFLKSCAKEGILKVKETKGDIVVTGVSPKHPAVAGHQPHRTVQSIEAQREKAEERQRKAQEAEEKLKTQIHVTELWKPHGSSLGLFVAAEVESSTLLSISQIREVCMKYISAKSLVNTNEQAYINVSEDAALLAAVSVKNEETPEFMKRDDVVSRVRANMQEWYEMRTEGGETIRKKGQIKPVLIEAKVRQGRKTSTFVTGFEHFGIDGAELAEALRKVCAGSTSVSPHRTNPHELEVLVQGIHITAVTDLLKAKGVPDKWIKATGLKEKKK